MIILLSVVEALVFIFVHNCHSFSYSAGKLPDRYQSAGKNGSAQRFMLNHWSFSLSEKQYKKDL